MPLMATGATVLGLYSHIAHSVDKEEGEIPPPFKGANQNKPEVEVNLKENLRNKDRTHQNPKRQMKCTHMIALTIIITNDYYTAPGQNRGCRPFNGQGSNRQFRGFTQ